MAQRDTRELDTGELDYDNEFWRFSLATYAQAEVATECLALQDAYDVDINMLLFCAWLGTLDITLKRDDIEAFSNLVAAWRENVVRPLRAVRERVKTLFRDEDFRTNIKGIELKAEQIEQAMLFAISRRLSRPSKTTTRDDSVAMNVRKYIEIKSQALPVSNAKASAEHLINAAQRLG